MRTPKSTRLADCASPISPLRTSNDTYASDVDGDSKDNGNNIPDVPRSDLLDSMNDGAGEHQGDGLDKVPLEPLRQPVSPFIRREAGRHVNEDLYVGDEGALDSDHEVSARAGAATSQRHKRNNRPFQDRRRDPTGTSLGQLSGDVRPIRTLRHLKLSLV